MENSKKIFWAIGVIVAIVGVAVAVAYFAKRYLDLCRDEEEYEDLFDCCDCECFDDCEACEDAPEAAADAE